MAEEATLTYFDGRGLAEIIRINLCFAKIPVGLFLYYTDLSSKNKFGVTCPGVSHGRQSRGWDAFSKFWKQNSFQHEVKECLPNAV